MFDRWAFGARVAGRANHCSISNLGVCAVLSLEPDVRPPHFHSHPFNSFIGPSRLTALRTRRHCRVFALLQATTEPELPGGYGIALLQSLLALMAVCILAWVLLRWASRRGLGTGSGKRVKVIERISLDARRSLYLVEIGGKVLLLGAGDGASPTLLAELDPDAIPEPEPGKKFADVLARLRGTSGDEP